MKFSTFKEFVKSNHWEHIQSHEALESTSVDVDVWDEENNRLVPRELMYISGVIHITSTLGDIVVTHSKGFEYNKEFLGNLTIEKHGTWWVEGGGIMNDSNHCCSFEDEDFGDIFTAPFSHVDYAVLHDQLFFGTE